MRYLCTDTNRIPEDLQFVWARADRLRDSCPFPPRRALVAWNMPAKRCGRDPVVVGLGQTVHPPFGRGPPVLEGTLIMTYM